MMTETEVILKFIYDARYFINENLDLDKVRIEVPCGSWVGSKRRSIGDIDLGVFPPIEAKGTFIDSLKDFESSEKNLQVMNYLYATTQDKLSKEFDYWSNKNLDNVIVYLSDVNKYKLLKHNIEDFDFLTSLLGGNVEIFRK